MNRVKILDCTLRDGGYINNWNFGKRGIKDIIDNLEKSQIDIIECGFIRNEEYNDNHSVFPSVEAISNFIQPKLPHTLYAAMIEQHNYIPGIISDYTGDSIDVIRLTFRKDEWESAKITAYELKNKGYKVCIQPVGTATYDDDKLLMLLNDVNELRPFAFYLVDTLGTMYRKQVRKFFYLIDDNLAQDICLGFHSHNNLQMSFANAQEIIRLSHRREIIIDTSCYGMGRGVGNLATELMVDYINHDIEQRYSITPILGIIDKYLMSIYSEQRWGYDVPYFLSGSTKCHPNYATYLMNKETLEIDKIEKLLNLIPVQKRSEYDSDFIENLYFDFQKCDIDDRKSYEDLRHLIENKKVLVLGAGLSIQVNKDKIDKVIEENNPYVITTNFFTDDYKIDALFVSNAKRLESINDNVFRCNCLLATSNLREKAEKNTLIFNYSQLLGEGDGSDNAGAMLIRILKRIGVSKVYLAGFDGFDVDASVNYYDASYKKALDYDTVKKKNDDISKQLRLALTGIDYKMITRTKYEI